MAGAINRSGSPGDVLCGCKGFSQVGRGGAVLVPERVSPEVTRGYDTDA